MRQMMKWFCGAILLMQMTTNYADNALIHRREVQAFINQMATKHHFDKKQLTAILREAKFQSQIVESMDKPFEKKSWDVYKELFLTPARVEAGLAFWRANQKALDRAEKEYHVPAHIIVAIIGVETLYGKHQGNYRVLDALTTLAFYYPKRAPYFTRELAEYLLLCREQGVSATQYLGSYAGAIGKPQFMPSSYRFYAVDFTGKGLRDLVNNDSDAIGSVANYFHKHGWKMYEGIATPANVQGSAYKKLATNSRIPDYPFNHLISVGVKPVVAVSKPPAKAGLIELTTQRGQEYWVAFPNFYVITHYNTSPQYALVVYLFSQQLYNQWAASSAKSHTLATV